MVDNIIIYFYNTSFLEEYTHRPFSFLERLGLFNEILNGIWNTYFSTKVWRNKLREEIKGNISESHKKDIVGVF